MLKKITAFISIFVVISSVDLQTLKKNEQPKVYPN